MRGGFPRAFLITPYYKIEKSISLHEKRLPVWFTPLGFVRLLLEVLFGEGIDLPSHPPCMLAYRQVVALHPVRIDRVADRRSLQGGFNLLCGPIDHTSGHVDHPTVCAFFDDDRVAQVGRWVTARFGQTPTCPFVGAVCPTPHTPPTRRRHGMDPSVADFSRNTSRRASCNVRLPTTQAGTSLHTGLKAIHT